MMFSTIYINVGEQLSRTYVIKNLIFSTTWGRVRFLTMKNIFPHKFYYR